MSGIKNKVVVITGAGAGIGRACASVFAREGARVVVADIDLPKAQETVAQIEAAGGNALAVETDVSSPASVQNPVQKTIGALARVHVILNNAAIQVNKTVEDTTVEEWNREMAVNLGGIFLCSKYFLPYLRQIRGNIINMASVNGFFVEPMCAGYCATKGAIIALTKAMAIDHGKEGIRVNCICPGYIDAGLAEGYFRLSLIRQQRASPPESSTRYGGSADRRRWHKWPFFLASDEASFMTGSAVVVDGGFGSGLAPQN